MLHTEPSFSVYADGEGLISIEKVDLKVKEGSDDFSFANSFENLGIKEYEDEDEDVDVNGLELKQITSFDEYKMMVDKDPSNPVFLKNYAQFLQVMSFCYFISLELGS